MPRFPAAPGAHLASLREGGRIWAVAAIHGQVERLRSLHRQLIQFFQADDQLIYLGGYLGEGRIAETVDELLFFRRLLLAQGVAVEDVVFLRGGQEEIWQKLLQLQFAARPGEVLAWMAANGVAGSIEAYGGNLKEGMAAAEEGPVSLTRWTAALRRSMGERDGHNQLFSALKHAAMTADGGVLFCHAGVHPDFSLEEQRDHFWWGAPAFETLDQSYADFRVVVRGHAPWGGSFKLSPPITTLDGGCARGGPLLAACFDQDGNALQLIEG